MNLHNLIFNGEPRSFTVHDRYISLLKQLSFKGPSRLFSNKGVSLCSNDAVFTESLLVTECGVFTADELTRTITSVNGLESSNLNIIRWDTEGCNKLPHYNSDILMLDFQQQCLIMFLNLFEDALSDVFIYMEERKVGDKHMLSKSAIQLSFANINLKIENIKNMVATVFDRRFIVSELQIIAAQLIKQLGGRAMLADSLVEYKWLFDLFCTIYFYEEA